MHKLLIVSSLACLDDHEAHDGYDEDEAQQQHDEVLLVDSAEAQDIVGSVGIATEQSETSSGRWLWVFV